MSLFVAGTPVQQGSKGAGIRAGKAFLFDTNSKTLRPWRKAVKAAAEVAWRDEGHAPIAGPVQATLTFLFPTVPSQPDRHWHAGKPDVDKLCRAAFDAFTDARLVADDALIVRVLASKRYVESHEQPGMHVEVDGLADHESLASTRRKRERTHR